MTHDRPKSRPRRAARRLSAAALVAAAMASPTTLPPAAAAPGSIRYRPNVPLDIERPGGEKVGLADPEVIKVGATWYLYGTADAAHGFEVWSSTDLAHWTYGGFVWRPTPGRWNDHGDLWAPDVYADESGYWLTYTAHLRIGVAHAASPLGPFIDQLDHPLVGGGHGGVGDGVLAGHGGPLDDLDERALDANLFRAADGSLTLYFSRDTSFAEIDALPMRDPTTPAAPHPTTVLSWRGELSGWEGFVREGPFAIEHAGVIHLMYSGSDYRRRCYAIGDATATEPLGPFTRRPDNPIFATDPATGTFGPGHHSVVAGARGDLLMFFHAHPTAASSARSTRYTSIAFDHRGRITVEPPASVPPTGGDPACRSDPSARRTRPPRPPANVGTIRPGSTRRGRGAG